MLLTELTMPTGVGSREFWNQNSLQTVQVLLPRKSNSHEIVMPCGIKKHFRGSSNSVGDSSCGFEAKLC